jgi:hypothetical protein
MNSRQIQIELVGLQGQMVVTEPVIATLISVPHVDTSEPADEITDEPSNLALHGRCAGALCAHL